MRHCSLACTANHCSRLAALEADGAQLRSSEKLSLHVCARLVELPNQDFAMPMTSSSSEQASVSSKWLRAITGRCLDAVSLDSCTSQACALLYYMFMIHSCSNFELKRK